VDEAGEVDGASVVAGGETAEMLETVEAALDSVAVFVEIGVMRDGDFARRLAAAEWSIGCAIFAGAARPIQACCPAQSSNAIAPARPVRFPA